MNLPNELMQIILNYLDQSTKHQVYRVISHLRELSPIQLIVSLIHERKGFNNYTTNRNNEKPGYNLYADCRNEEIDCINLHLGSSHLVTYPPSIITLTISNPLNINFSHTIKKLILNDIVLVPNLSIFINISSLTITFNDWTKHKVKLENLPPNLKNFSVKGYDCYVTTMILSNTIKKLTFSVKFKPKNLCEYLPINLVYLSLWFDEIIDDLPHSLKKLSLNYEFQNNIDFLPPNLQVLNLYCNYKGKLKYLPPSLKTLNTRLNINLDHLTINKLILICNNINIPKSLTTLILLEDSFSNKIADLPNLIRLIHPSFNRIHYPPSLKYLKILKDEYLNYDDCKKLFDEKYNEQIILPSYTMIDSNVLHGYSTINVKKLILYNCGPYFNRTFSHDVRISSIPGYSCHSDYNCFFTFDNDVQIKGFTITNGIVTHCQVKCVTFANIVFFPGIKEINFYVHANSIKCPDSLVKFILNKFNDDVGWHEQYIHNYSVDEIYDGQDMTVILSKSTKEFRVNGKNFGRIYVPVVPHLMDHCDNRFTVPFVPARRIVY